MSADPRYVFVVGTGRCGSSFLHEILAKHPDVGFISNIDDRMVGLDLKGRWNNSIYRRVPPRLTRKGRLRFAPSEGYRALGRHVSPILVEPPRDLTESDASPWLSARLRRFYDSRSAAQKRPVFTHKFTGWSRARLLHGVFPEARFIHVYRDGRAVANSLVQMPWWSGHLGPDRWRWGRLSHEDRTAWEMSAQSWPVLAAIEWKILMESLSDAQAHIPPEQWLSVKYEDFVADSQDWLRRILGFAGLEDSAGFWSHVRRNPVQPGRVDAYRKDLAAADIDMMEKVIGRHLASFGYSVDA